MSNIVSMNKKKILNQGDRSRKQLEDFFAECMNDVQQGAVTQVSCMHMIAGGQLSEVYTLAVSPEVHTPEAIAKVVRGRAEGYAGGLSNQQTFLVLVFYNNQDEPGAKLSFSLTGRTDFDGATESPDARGQIAQNMRHHETVLGQAFRHQEHLNKHSLDLLTAGMQRERTLQQENDRIMSFMKQTMVEKLTLEHSKEMERMKYERDSKIIDKLVSFAPMLVNSLTNKEVFPVASTDSLIVDQIVRTIRQNPKLLEAMSSADVPAESMAMLMQRFSQVAEKQDAEERAARQIHPEVADPEAEAAGELQPDTGGERGGDNG